MAKKVSFSDTHLACSSAIAHHLSLSVHTFGKRTMCPVFRIEQDFVDVVHDEKKRLDTSQCDTIEEMVTRITAFSEIGDRVLLVGHEGSDFVIFVVQYRLPGQEKALAA